MRAGYHFSPVQKQPHQLIEVCFSSAVLCLTAYTRYYDDDVETCQIFAANNYVDGCCVDALAVAGHHVGTTCRLENITAMTALIISIEGKFCFDLYEQSQHYVLVWLKYLLFTPASLALRVTARRPYACASCWPSAAHWPSDGRI